MQEMNICEHSLILRDSHISGVPSILPSASACEGPACKARRLADASTRVCLLFAIKRGTSLLMSDVLVQGVFEHPASSMDSAMQEGVSLCPAAPLQVKQHGQQKHPCSHEGMDC